MAARRGALVRRQPFYEVGWDNRLLRVPPLEVQRQAEADRQRPDRVAAMPVGPLGAFPPASAQFLPETIFVPVNSVMPAAPALRRLHSTDLALAAFLFALGAFVTDGITAPVAAVLTVMALVRAWRTGEPGAGLAIAGGVLTILTIFFIT